MHGHRRRIFGLFQAKGASAKRLTAVCHILVCMSRGMAGTATEMTMRAAQLKKAGGPENLYVGEVSRPTPQQGEVLIEVKATAINRADTLQRKGQYPVPPGVTDILGLEAAGTVSSLGPGCRQPWKVGDRVMALLGGGGNAEYVVTPEDQLIRIPDKMDYTQAAAIPEAWLTAFQLLHTLAKVKKGESVLIHGGASGVGTAAIQLCLEAGALPFVTAGSPAKLESTRQLGAVGAFNYKEDNVTEKVLAATGGKGVNVILDCVGGSMYEHNVQSIGLDGRWVVFGLMGGPNISGDFLRKVLAKRITMIGTTLRSRSNEYKKQLVSDFSKLALPRFESGFFKPIIHTVMPLTKIREAHEMMEANINTGKIVLTVDGISKDEL